MKKLFSEIINCENIEGPQNNPCKKIISFQSGDSFQLPEPWNGDLVNSKMIFISSNPSIDSNEYYPTKDWNEDDVFDYFINRFTSDKRYVKNYLYPRQTTGYAPQWVRYWAFVRSIARQLLEYEPVPGNDYVLTEIVKCKSHNEYGVAEALNECKSKYLQRLLSLNNSRVIVLIGDKARDVFQEHYDIDLINNELQTLTINEQDKLIFATPHSNARKKRKLTSILSFDSIQRLRKLLKA